MSETHDTREAWLGDAVNRLRATFEAAGFTVPPVHVSCGWPSVQALSRKRRRIGECWDTTASKDGKHQIFISPYLEETATADGVLSTLVHELVHAAVGIKAKHGKAFRKCALAVGLEGKMTATVAGEPLLAKLRETAEALGTYPHAQLDLEKRPTKKQSTRMIKCECGTCGYTVRTTRKWLEEVGAPHCPKHGAMAFELPDPAEESDDDDAGDE